jgi:hypothetical protein
MACTSSCFTQDHASYGECLRSKNLKTAVSIPGKDYDRSGQPAWDKRIDTYKQARSEGIQPASTRASDIKAAISHSDKTGTAYVAQ